MRIKMFQNLLGAALVAVVSFGEPCVNVGIRQLATALAECPENRKGVPSWLVLSECVLGPMLECVPWKDICQQRFELEGVVVRLKVKVHFVIGIGAQVNDECHARYGNA